MNRPFKKDKGLPFFILPVTRSRRVPRGQIHPQKNLPRKSEKRSTSNPGRRRIVKALAERR